MQQTVVWNTHAEKFRALGYEIATVTKDSADALGKFAARRDIGITLLSDPQSSMITAFGVRDDRYGSGPYAGIAKPSIFVVDADGKLVYSQPVNHYGESPVDNVYAALLDK